MKPQRHKALAKDRFLSTIDYALLRAGGQDAIQAARRLLYVEPDNRTQEVLTWLRT